MKLFQLLFLLLLSSPVFAQSGEVFTWVNGNPTLPDCSATVTSSCLTGYILTDATVSPGTVINSTIPATALTYTETPLPGVGSHTYSLVATGKDQSGNSASSVPVTVIVTVPSITLNPPTGFTATP
jgi:hypothetical protein